MLIVGFLNATKVLIRAQLILEFAFGGGRVADVALLDIRKYCVHIEQVNTSYHGRFQYAVALPVRK